MKSKSIIWIVFGAFVLFLLFAPHQNVKITDLAATFAGFSLEHPFGTDNLGRDLFALMIEGGQRTLLVVLIATAIAFVGGTLLGMVAAYRGGLVKSLIQFLADFVTVVPSLVVALVFSALFGFSATMAGIVFGIGNMGQYINLSQELTAETKAHDFINAEHSLGLRGPAILFMHILPNIARRMVVYMGNNASSVVLQYAGLAFIGLGVDTTNPDWGTLLYDYRIYMLTHPELILIPMAGVTILALFFHFAFDDGKVKDEELTIYD